MFPSLGVSNIESVGFLDVTATDTIIYKSLCHIAMGILNGRHVDVRLPFSQLPKYTKGGYKAALYKEAKSTGKYIKGLFSSVSTLC